MASHGIVLGHLVSPRGIEVDNKIDVIFNLLYPTNITEVRSFLSSVGFYWSFIKDFSKVALPLSSLLLKHAQFDFDIKCKKAFDILTGSPDFRHHSLAPVPLMGCIV